MGDVTLMLSPEAFEARWGRSRPRWHRAQEVTPDYSGRYDVRWRDGTLTTNVLPQQIRKAGIVARDGKHMGGGSDGMLSILPHRHPSTHTRRR